MQYSQVLINFQNLSSSEYDEVKSRMAEDEAFGDTMSDIAEVVCKGVDTLLSVSQEKCLEEVMMILALR